MSDFMDAYRKKWNRDARCPKCQTDNVPGASLVLEIVGTLGFCSNCSYAGPAQLFLPKPPDHGAV